ncbi:MAG: helix-turn-helix transcriptional regulator [Clostridiales bacterium]|nr:helix-turn-helix transcriptional regulator [Clostridiales bacterium]
MKNPIISKQLKKYRKLRKMTVHDVALRIEEDHGCKIAEKTIYGWESGQTQPDADTLLYLCTLYNIPDVLYSFGYQSEKGTPLSLTYEEENIIRSYRRHPEFHQAIKKLLLDNTNRGIF